MVIAILVLMAKDGVDSSLNLLLWDVVYIIMVMAILLFILAFLHTLGGGNAQIFYVMVEASLKLLLNFLFFYTLI
jgi:hypothetical protein